jgi:threonine dehydratase
LLSVKPEISLEDIREAAQRIRFIAHRTPVLTSRNFDTMAGVAAHFKCENFQRGGAFKIRGASNFIFSIPSTQAARGVVAYSSGNHAQAVAIAAAFLGIPATLVMPWDAPRSKIEATRAHGATIVSYDRHKDSREAIGKKIASETGATLVPPYDHPRIIAGQGTAALELFEDLPEIDALIAPVGGGGLLAGCAIAAKGLNPRLRIFGAEPEIANDTYLSLQAGHRVEIPPTNTIADGLRSPQPGEITFPILQRFAEAVLLVSEEEIKSTVKFLLSRLKILVEPSGAVAAAAVLHHKLPGDIRSIGVILSGGNMDLELLAQW